MTAAKPQITLLVVGKLREPFWRDAEAEYRRRLTGYTSKLVIVEVTDEPTPPDASPAQEAAVRKKEGDRLLAKIGAREHVVALDRAGQMLDSPGLAARLALATNDASAFTFVIGGSLGLHEGVLGRANLRLSFGPLTFPHQIMRVLVLEQLYRAFKIQRNEPYHK